MENLFVTYKQALELKKLGFDERCFTKYYESGKLADSLSYLHHNYFGQVNAPLYQQAFKWFRDKHNLYMQTIRDGGWYAIDIGDLTNEDDESPQRSLVRVGEYRDFADGESECLDKLIEITKK